MKPIHFFDLWKIALEAGQEILEVYEKDFQVEFKEDASPVTQADKRAHLSIVKNLSAIDSRIPILSEEGIETPYQERCTWDTFWLVDPLDGTKEFVKKNGEFTVNIALIKDHYPVLGIIYAPVLDIVYFGRVGEGAYKLEQASKVNIKSEEELMDQSTALPERKDRRTICIVASRSHRSVETQEFIEELEKAHGKVEVISSGSSLKFCLVAEGKADYYPRYAPTMEWDTGAGQAIVEAAGGKVMNYDDGGRFSYNKENLLNGWFLAENEVPF
jgi:3'(2'), 5'-bisphosphate nucleotidase